MGMAEANLDIDARKLREGPGGAEIRAASGSIAPPRAEKRPVTSTFHGHARIDDYSWLRAENWQEVMRNPAALPADIRAYLEAENA